jgi:hypothetical protein
VKRSEIILLALFLACWLLEIGVFLGWVRFDGSLPLALYPYYGAAMSLGWLFGLLCIGRTGDMERNPTRRFVLFYFVGPIGFLFLLRDMATIEAQRAAPFVPLWGLGVYAIFFITAVILRPLPRRLK